MINLSSIRKRQSFRSYVKEQMKESLITGVPEIASSESNSRRNVKSFIFLFCTVGFLYQTYAFLETFFKYETIQDFRIEHPLKFMAPAITICNKNRINRHLFCPAFPEECLWYENRKDFCKEVPKLCAYLRSKRGPLGVPRKGIDTYYNRSNEFLDAYGPQTPLDFLDIRFYCYLNKNGVGEKCKSNDSILIPAPSGGLPYKCFTLYSLLDKPYEEPKNININDYYFVKIKAVPEQLMDNDDNVQFYVHVHDPRQLANPISEGISLNAGFQYTFSFTMQQIQTLPPPYNTHCFDYLKKWKENGGRGPITKKDCIELCKIEKMMESYSCVGQSITYPHRFPICSEIITISDKVIEECSSGCREACDVTLYTVSAKHVEDEMEMKCFMKSVNMKPNCKYEEIDVSLKFGQLSVQRIFNLPKFQNVEVFSFIGGFVGIWLGVSLLTFVDFLETVADVITFAVVKWKKMHGKKRTRRIFFY